MDCRTARLLLDFARPTAPELEAEEATALAGHLDHCSECHGQAEDQHRLDNRLGQAMRQVEVPAGLRDQLLARLESERGDWYRRRFAHGARLTVAAAAVLLLLWGTWYWVSDHFVAPIDPRQVAVGVQSDAAEDPRTRAEEALKRLGAETELPRDLDYHYLVGMPSRAELPGYPGRLVPMLVFVKGDQRAYVYLIRDRAIPKDTPPQIDGATFRAELLPAAGERYRFLVIHNGANLDWLQPPAPQAA